MPCYDKGFQKQRGVTSVRAVDPDISDCKPSNLLEIWPDQDQVEIVANIKFANFNQTRGFNPYLVLHNPSSSCPQEPLLNEADALEPAAGYCRISNGGTRTRASPGSLCNLFWKPPHNKH
eukprot:1161928-Pelagomonas_calceolata.AAC.12